MSLPETVSSVSPVAFATPYSRKQMGYLRKVFAIEFGAMREIKLKVALNDTMYLLLVMLLEDVLTVRFNREVAREDARILEAKNRLVQSFRDRHGHPYRRPSLRETEQAIANGSLPVICQQIPGSRLVLPIDVPAKLAEIEATRVKCTDYVAVFRQELADCDGKPDQDEASGDSAPAAADSAPDAPVADVG